MSPGLRIFVVALLPVAAVIAVCTAVLAVVCVTVVGALGLSRPLIQPTIPPPPPPPEPPPPPPPLSSPPLPGGCVVVAARTVSVKLCEAEGLWLAVTVKVCVPTAVVPAMVISPVVLFMLTPVGWPVSE